jgi:hypothetical protein
MPRVAASNGVRPEIRALAVIQMNKPVTPAEINAHVGTGDYAAKYISFLKNRFGFTFSVQKNGRQVVSYTLLKEPKNVAELRGTKARVSAHAARTQVAVAKVAKPAKAAKSAKVSSVSVKPAKVDVVQQQFGSTGEVSYAIDNDFDSMDGVDVKALVG